ncbi:MAG: hypothetical protein UDB11_01935 [Peptococcaceae bacterium]|nr:hypothetical protein [Peptococcaceae bacterium]
MHRSLNLRAFLWLLLALVVGSGCLAVGQADDAPGLGGLGLLVGLALVLHALHLAGCLQRGSGATILLAVCGALAVIAPPVLYADGEIAWPSPFWLAMPLGCALLFWAARRWRLR